MSTAALYLGPKRRAATNLRPSPAGQRCISCPSEARTTFDLVGGVVDGLVGHLCDDCLDSYQSGKPSRVYFIRAGDMVKIGHSVDVETRLKLHQTGSSVPLEVWHTEYGGREEEAELHRRFAGDRSHGEWFRISDAIRAYVEDRA